MSLICGFDLETTGLLEPEHRIIEIAAILYDSVTEEPRFKWIQRVNPQRPIDPKAQAVHHIAFEDVAHCPTFEEVAEKLVKVLKKSSIVVAHNGAGFDLPFVVKELQRVGQPVPSHFELVDTMLDGRWATPLGKYPNLGELCFACRVPYDPTLAHGAEYDVDVMMKSYFHARRKGFYKKG